MIPLSSSFLFSFLLVLFVVLSLSENSLSAVIGIDFGTEAYKVALVKAGKVDIVENEDSRRKTPNLIAFYREERLFSDAGYKRLTKSPENSFIFLNELLGRTYPATLHPSLAYPVSEDTNRHTLSLSVDDDSFSPEELVAMILEKLKDQTAIYSGGLVKDAVITVPPFWTHSQRQALIDAARIAGLNILSLLNEDTAVAMNYALMRDVTNVTKNVIFYDMGETSTKVSVVSFKVVNVKEKKSKKTVKMPSLQVLGYGWDDSLGGRDFDYVLTVELAERASKKLKTDIKKNKRAMALLLKEAKRVKEVLSANVETFAQVEGLTEDFNLKELVTRTEFEELCKGFFERILPPIHDALAAANLKKEDIEAFEMVGGNHRIPKVLASLDGFWGKPVDRHLNADEAAVFGATFFGAHLHPYVKIQDVKVKELNTYQIDAKLLSASGELISSEILFPNTGRISSETGLKKSIQFVPASLDDFKVVLFYNDARFPKSFNPEIAEYSFSGLSQLQDVEYVGDATVSVVFKLSPSTTVVFESCEVKFNVTVEAVPSTEAEAETEKKTEEKTVEDKADEPVEKVADESEVEEVKESDTETDTETQATDSTQPSDSTPPTETVQTRERRIKLTAAPPAYSFNHLDDASFKAAKKRLEDYNHRDKVRREREESINRLESFVYEMKDRLQNDEKYLEVSTEPEREKIIEELTEAGDWIYDGGAESDTSEFKKRLQRLNSSLADIELRRKEKAFRPDAVALLRAEIERGRSAMKNITNALEVTEEQRDDFLATCTEVEQWLAEKEEEQSTKALTETPAFLTSDLFQKYTTIGKTLRRLTSSPRKKPPKKEKKETTVEPTEETAEKATEEPSPETPTDETQGTETKEEVLKEEQKVVE